MKLKFYILILSIPFSALCQKSVDVRNIKGSAIIAGDVSPNRARELALNEAKVNAMKEAGIDEHVNTWQMLFTSQVSNDYSQFFSSDIQSELQGAVKSHKLISEKIYCRNEKEIVCEVVINAEVVKYHTKPDPSFSAHIEGLKGSYNHGDNLNFSVKASKDCYLTVFNITDSEALLLYPNPFEKLNKLPAMESRAFPTADIDYKLGNEKKPQETNRLIFVFTREQIPFLKLDREQVTGAEHIFSWLYSIPPDQRRVEYVSLSIAK